MDTNIVINISSSKAIGLGAVVIVGSWWIATNFGSLKEAVKNFSERLTNLEGRVDEAFKSSSPISLLPRGKKILEDSGLKEWIDNKKDELIESCKKVGSTANPYDIQVSAFKLFDEIDFGDESDRFKSATYQAGMPMDVFRRIGAIYFRDLCLQQHGHTPESLDEKPDDK